MDKVTEALPFTEKDGTLYIGPLGTEIPDMTVKRGRFVEDWPDGWLKVGKTAPKECRAVRLTDRVSVGVFVSGVGLDDNKRIWTFGLSEVNMSRTPLATLDQLGYRLMLGWESEDDRDRVIAMQARPHEDDRPTRSAVLFSFPYELETTSDGQLFKVYLAGAPIRPA